MPFSGWFVVVLSNVPRWKGRDGERVFNWTSSSGRPACSGRWTDTYSGFQRHGIPFCGNVSSPRVNFKGWSPSSWAYYVCRGWYCDIKHYVLSHLFHRCMRYYRSSLCTLSASMYHLSVSRVCRWQLLKITTEVSSVWNVLSKTLPASKLVREEYLPRPLLLLLHHKYMWWYMIS